MTRRATKKLLGKLALFYPNIFSLEERSKYRSGLIDDGLKGRRHGWWLS